MMMIRIRQTDYLHLGPPRRRLIQQRQVTVWMIALIFLGTMVLVKSDAGRQDLNILPLPPPPPPPPPTSLLHQSQSDATSQTTSKIPPPPPLLPPPKSPLDDERDDIQRPPPPLLQSDRQSESSTVSEIQEARRRNIVPPPPPRRPMSQLDTPTLVRQEYQQLHPDQESKKTVPSNKEDSTQQNESSQDVLTMDQEPDLTWQDVPINSLRSKPQPWINADSEDDKNSADTRQHVQEEQQQQQQQQQKVEIRPDPHVLKNENDNGSFRPSRPEYYSLDNGTVLQPTQQQPHIVGQTNQWRNKMEPISSVTPLQSISSSSQSKDTVPSVLPSRNDETENDRSLRHPSEIVDIRGEYHSSQISTDGTWLAPNPPSIPQNQVLKPPSPNVPLQGPRIQGQYEPLSPQAYGHFQNNKSFPIESRDQYQHASTYSNRLPQTQHRRYTPPPDASSKVSSTWKVLWGKVERSLDGLAKVEDSVTGRAQQFLSTVTSSSRTRPPQSFDETRRIAQERSSKVTTPTKTPLTPYGTKFDVAKKHQQDVAPQTAAKMKVDSSRQINWNDITTGKMIRANGGASSPDGQLPTPPSNPSVYIPPNSVVPPPSINAQNDMTVIQTIPPNTEITQPYIANPYMQSSHLKSPPKQPSIATETHSRSSRIPWDTSTSTSQVSRYAASLKRPTPRGASSNNKADYDAEKAPFMSKLFSVIPQIPRIPNPINIFRLGKKSSYQYANMDAWKDDDEDSSQRSGFLGLFRRKSTGDSLPSPMSKSTSKSGDALAPPLKNLMARCDNGKTTSLLSTTDEIRCRTIGRYQAFFDGLCVLFVILAIQQADGLQNVAFPISMKEFTLNTVPLVASFLRDAVHTWAPIFAGYAYLAIYAKRKLLNARVHKLSRMIGALVEDESQYAQLYLRLAAAIRMDSSLSATMRQAAASQVRSLVAIARLNSFVTMVLATLIVMTVTVIGPFLTAMGQSLCQLVLLDELRAWPIAWKALGTNMRQIMHSLVLTLEGHAARALTLFLDNPLQFAFHLSIIASSLLITLIPTIEKRRKVNPDKDDDEDVAISSSESAQQFARLGASSATRLTMLSENGSIENALERWRSNRAVTVDESSKGAMFLAIRRFVYIILAAVVATMPILLSYLVGMVSVNNMNHIGLQWDSILDVSVVLFGMFMVARNAILTVMSSCQKRSTIKAFLTSLSNTLEEIRETNRRQTDIQFMAAVSPTAGLVVKDLWAAHTTKRAWAVRGANLQCKNGELLVLLGDDGAGKTRILTTIAESLLSPPRRSLTSNKVRGFVGIGGVESAKWDKSVLKRRLGVLLSDVRTVADTASLYSGWSMEEILEPVDGLRLAETDHKLSSSEKSSMLLALKMTGLYSTLIPKLPSKLSTVLTANEEDLRPSALRPRSQVLSPAEWSKLILAKVLAQTIYDNENAAASTDKIENCMVGSVLLLDDPTVLLSEVEEAKILRDLRQSGAATVMATNKWATGRFADHIAVVRDGAIVESGTHNELISRGPQQSLYAAKWHAMTTQ